MKNCAFLTLDEPAGFVIDDEHAIEPLKQLGWSVTTLSWRQSELSWEQFDAVVIRSTWDYWNHVDAFLEVLTDIDRQTRLANPLSIVRWNLAKTYLADLHSSGVAVVPTFWPDTLKLHSLKRCFSSLGSDELVIKPVIGANGEDAFRISSADSERRLAEVLAHFSNRRAMVQRFMPNILTEGEYSLFFFNGEFSHAILKKPAESEFRSQEERGASIRPVEPQRRLLIRARQSLAALPAVPLYARADFVRDGAEDFVVMELELIEPSMYLRTNPDAPARFARAIEDRFSPA